MTVQVMDLVLVLLANVTMVGPVQIAAVPWPHAPATVTETEYVYAVLANAMPTLLVQTAASQRALQMLLAKNVMVREPATKPLVIAHVLQTGMVKTAMSFVSRMLVEYATETHDLVWVATIFQTLVRSMMAAMSVVVIIQLAPVAMEFHIQESWLITAEFVVETDQLVSKTSFAKQEHLAQAVIRSHL